MLSIIRIAVRMLLRRPGLAAGRILTVSIVVAAVSAVFAVANATFLGPLPFPDGGRLVRINLQPPGTSDLRDANPLDVFEFAWLRTRARTLERLEGIWVADRAVVWDTEPESVRAGRVSDGFFDVLGGRPVVGRAFTVEETDTGARVSVISDGLWDRRFARDPAIVGRTLTIDREAHTIVGVAPRGFDAGFTGTEFWTPLSARPGVPPMMLKAVQSIGLLRAETDIALVRQELETHLSALARESPALFRGWTMRVTDLREAQYGSRRPATIMLFAAVGALALIAIANLANLTLADVLSRRSELAVCAALGGSRVRVAAPELAQGVVVAVAGGIAGFLAGSWLARSLLALDPSAAAASVQVRIDWRVSVCAFAAAIVVMAAAVCIPLLRAVSPGIAAAAAASARGTIGAPAARARIALVSIQTALAVVLLSSAALVVASFTRSTRVEPGFDAENVLTAQLRLPASVFPTNAHRASFVEQVLERLSHAPEVLSAGTTLNPFIPGDSFQTLVHVEDHPTEDGQPYAVQFRRVSPGYFETMRIAMLSGRAFTNDDRVDRQLVAIVSRSFARRFWPDVDPIGRRIKRGASATQWSLVVGVVDDVRDNGIDQVPADTVYAPYFQASNAAAPVALVVRTALSPSAAVAAVQRAVWAVDPKQPLGQIGTLDEFLAASLGPQRFRASVLALAGALGLLLATVGTYGITARSVVERTREVGVRLALGGRPERILWAVARDTLRACAGGAIAGTVVAAFTGAVLGTVLPELRGSAWSFSVYAAAVLLAIGSVATLLAARAATSVDPTKALRG